MEATFYLSGSSCRRSHSDGHYAGQAPYMRCST